VKLLFCTLLKYSVVPQFQRLMSITNLGERMRDETDEYRWRLQSFHLVVTACCDEMIWSFVLCAVYAGQSAVCGIIFAEICNVCGVMYVLRWKYMLAGMPEFANGKGCNFSSKRHIIFEESTKIKIKGNVLTYNAV
jgi:hypothetical protein